MWVGYNFQNASSQNSYPLFLSLSFTLSNFIITYYFDRTFLGGLPMERKEPVKRISDNLPTYTEYLQLKHQQLRKHTSKPQPLLALLQSNPQLQVLPSKPPAALRVA